MAGESGDGADPSPLGSAPSEATPESRETLLLMEEELSSCDAAAQVVSAAGTAGQHPAWTEDMSWKHRLDNLRLLLQPFIRACLLLPWLRLYPLPHLTAGLADLCAVMNTYRLLFPT